MKISKILTQGFILSSLSLSTSICQGDETAQNQDVKPFQQSNKFLIYGDFLWWRADANDVELACKETALADGVTIDKNVIELNGKWEPGFRVGVGYHFGFYDQLDLLLTYTRFHGRSKHVSVTADSLDTPFLRQYWTTFLGPIAFSASGHWNVGLDVGDIEIGRKYDVSEHLFIRPHGGVRLAWVNFEYHANYDGVWIDATPAIVTQETSMRASSRLNAGGLRGGSAFLWKFCDNLGLFGDFSASLLYGHFKVNEKFAGADTLETGTLSSITEKYKEKMFGVRANIEALLGLKGWVDFSRDRYRFWLFAGYELSEWFRVNELFKVVRAVDTNGNAMFTTEHVSNDIGFQGLTVRAGFAF